MNIFNLDDKEFDKKINEIFDNINPEELLEELVECGLKINDKVEYSISNSYIMENEYDYSLQFNKTKMWDKLFNKKKNNKEKLMEAA